MKKKLRGYAPASASRVCPIYRLPQTGMIEVLRFPDETSDTSAVEEIIELNQRIFKRRIISEEGPGKPEGQVLPSEVFTVTRAKAKN